MSPGIVWNKKLNGKQSEFSMPPGLSMAPWKAPCSNMFMYPHLFFRVNSLQQVEMSILDDEPDRAFKTLAQFRSCLGSALGAHRTALLGT